jgi:CheY-like chemotaxis protein
VQLTYPLRTLAYISYSFLVLGRTQKGSQTGRKLRNLIVIVDDEQSVRTYIKTVLENEGFQTLEAENGVQALERLIQVTNTVALVVSDVKMPEMDGIALARAVRARFPAIPVVLVSGYADPNTLDELKLEVVSKPFLPAELVAAVRKAIRSRPKS